MVFDMPNVGRSVNAGLIGGAISYYMRPNATLSLSLINLEMSLYVALGASTAGAHLISSMIIENVFPALDVSEKFREPTSAALSIATNAAASSALLYAMNPLAVGELSIPRILMYSVVSDVAGNYVYDNLTGPLLLQN